MRSRRRSKSVRAASTSIRSIAARRSAARRGAFPPACIAPDCDIHYKDPSPSTFSFNSPIGACETCRGFGRSIGVDYGLVIPDTALSLREGAIKPWQTESYEECQDGSHAVRPQARHPGGHRRGAI